MTDNEIIKALECCLKLSVKVCPECPYYRKEDCSSTLIQDTINLINRQKAEVERLERSAKQWEDTAKDLYISRENIEAEAVKEFAERLKHMLGLISGFDYDCSTIFYHIDNLVKEMVGADGGK